MRRRASTGPLRALRRLLYCGEWIESHALHVYMLHAPDFLGYESAIHMAKDHAERREEGARAEEGRQRPRGAPGRPRDPPHQRAGSAASTACPTRRELAPDRGAAEAGARRSRSRRCAGRGLARVPRLRAGLRVRRAAPPRRVPAQRGPARLEPGASTSRSPSTRSTSSRSTSPHANALHSVHKGHGRLPRGPARALQPELRPAARGAQDAARAAGLGPVCRNPFKSIVVRAVELVFACHEALRAHRRLRAAGPPVRRRRAPRAAPATAPPRRRAACSTTATASTRRASSSARRSSPRPSQNQKTIENDLWHFVPTVLDLPKDELTWRCEQAIRNYDPCISCATHFLKLDLRRTTDVTARHPRRRSRRARGIRRPGRRPRARLARSSADRSGPRLDPAHARLGCAGS